MGILLNRILVVLIEEDLDSTNYHIAMIILERFSELDVITIGELSKLCNVSKSTISKFVRHIGFEDYQEFRDAIPNKEHSEYSYNSNVMQYIESESIEKYKNAIITDINSLTKILSNNNIDRLANDLISYKKVAAFGLLYSETAAIDLQTKLAYNNKFIFTSINDVKQHEYIENANSDTLIIIFSHSGNYLMKHQMVDGEIHKSAFEKTKAKIVLITSNNSAKIRTKADYCIIYPCLSGISTHTIMYSIITDYITVKYRELITAL